MPRQRGRNERNNSKGDKSNTPPTQFAPDPTWDGIDQARNEHQLAGIVNWLVEKHGRLIFACVKSKLPYQQDKEWREDLFVEVLFGCSRWIERDLRGRPNELKAIPLKRLVLCKTTRLVARWLRREARWRNIKSLDALPSVAESLVAPGTASSSAEPVTETFEEDWSDKDVERLFNGLDLSATERRVVLAHLALKQECENAQGKYSKRGYRRLLAKKLSAEGSTVTVSFVARYLKSARKKCVEYLGRSRRPSDSNGGFDGPKEQTRHERAGSDQRSDDLAQPRLSEGGVEP